MSKTDSLKIFEKLRKSFPEKEAETIASSIEDAFDYNNKSLLSVVATKEDIANLKISTHEEIAALKLSTKEDFANFKLSTSEDINALKISIKEDMTALKESTKGDITSLKEDILNYRSEIYRAMLIQAGVIIGSVVALLKFVP